MEPITPPNEEPITLEFIARAAGVSPSTVSRILNGTAKVSEAKRLAVEQTIARFNFRPNALARGLALGQTMSIGVLTQNIESPFYGEALRGIEEALASTSYIPLFVSGHWNLREEVERMSLLQGRRVDGVIVLTGRLSDQQLIDYAKQTPIVITGRSLQAPGLYGLDLDHQSGACLATKYLIELGHTRIAFIAGPAEMPDARARLQGYQQALQEADLPFDPALVVQSNFQAAGGVLATNQLINSRVNFSAIFSANDQMAYGARIALYRLNIRVPDDMSLIGFDDLPSSSYAMPPLTTMRQPVYEIGQLAAQAMLGLINKEPVEMQLPPLELVVRESVRRLRN